MVLNIFDDVANTLENAMEAASNQLANLGFENAGSLKQKILDSGGYKNL